MPELTKNLLKKALLEIYARPRPSANGPVMPALHKINVIGRPYQGGALEHHLTAAFSTADRQIASQALEELIRDGYILPTYSDMPEPENWLQITDAGQEHLRRDLKDAIDRRLEEIGPHLVELRAGMWDAVRRSSPDAARQAASSARELIDHVLKEDVPEEHKGLPRKERVRVLLRKYRGHAISEKDVEIINISASFVIAEHEKLQQMVHGRFVPKQRDVRASVEATERALSLLFADDPTHDPC